MNSHLPTLSSAIDAAIEHAEKKGYRIASDERDNLPFQSVSYGETRSFSISLITAKGNPARKALQLTVHRPALDEPFMGQYETNFYIL